MLARLRLVKETEALSLFEDFIGRAGFAIGENRERGVEQWARRRHDRSVHGRIGSLTVAKMRPWCVSLIRGDGHYADHGNEK